MPFAICTQALEFRQKIVQSAGKMKDRIKSKPTCAIAVIAL
jgi:hypothetical protein